MPNPKQSQYWRGHSPTTDLPGGNRILRVVAVGAGAWTKISMSDAGIGGGADALAQNPKSDVNGRFRCISILNMSSVAGEDIKISLNVVNNAPDPAGAYNVVLTDGPSIELRFPAEPAVGEFWVKADAGNPDAQMELWYDVPPDS